MLMGFSQDAQGDRGTGKGSDGLANLQRLNHWVLRAFKVVGADLWYRATRVLLQGPEQVVRLSLDEERENTQGCICSGPCSPLLSRRVGYKPSHCLTHAGPLQIQGEYRLFAALHDSTWAQGQFLKGEFAAFPLGRRWVVQHPQLTLWDRVR